MRRATAAEFDARLAALAALMEGVHRSFEYIQDYVNIAGLRVWQEELSRIVSYNVEQECNTFLRARQARAPSRPPPPSGYDLHVHLRPAATIVTPVRYAPLPPCPVGTGAQVHDWESAFQSEAIPIPRFPPTDADSLTCMGRLARELLRQSDPLRTVYLAPLSSWFEMTDGGRDSVEALGLRTFGLLRDAVGVAGLAGLDRLLSFMSAHRLQGVLAHYRARMAAGAAELLAATRRALGPPAGLPEGGLQYYAESLLRASKALVMGPLQEGLVAVGQAQLLRRQIASELACASHLDSNQLTSALEAANEAVLEDVRAHYRNPDAAPYPAAESTLLPELGRLLLSTGQHNALTQVYVAPGAEWLRELPALLFFFTLAQLPRYAHDAHLACLRPARRYAGSVPDATPLVMGIATLLRQVHVGATHAYLALLGQYARVQAQAAAAALAQDGAARGRAEHPAELTTLMSLLEALCRWSQIPRETVQLYVPPWLMDTAFVKP